MKPSYRWVIVAAGALMSCVAIGVMFSLAIFLEPMALDTQWSRAGISSAMTLNFLVMGLGGFAWGAIYDRVGARPVVFAGTLLLGLAMVLARLRLAAGVPAHLWRAGRARGQRLLRADDRADHDLVRHQPQPCGVAGLGRHGCGADDDLTLRALADHRL